MQRIPFEFYMNGSDCFVVEQMLGVLGYMSFLSLFGAFPFGLVADHIRSKLSGKRKIAAKHHQLEK